MNIQTLKYEIIEWIIQSNDNSLLVALKSIKDSNIATTDWFEDLSQAEKDSINRGVLDHEQERILTSREFWASDESKI